MKKFAHISAWIFSFIFMTGIFFSSLKLPLSNILIYLGETVAGLICLPLIFFFKWREHELTENRLLFQWLFGQLAVVIFVISTWLRFNNHYFANITLLISFTVLAFTFLPLLFYNMYKQSLEEI